MYESFSFEQIPELIRFSLLRELIRVSFHSHLQAAKSFRDKLKDKQGMKDLFSQVAIDQIVHIPFVFYPCYYLTKSMIMEKPIGHENDSTIGLAYYKWKINFFDDLKTSWMIWIPANLINFGFMPMHFRVRRRGSRDFFSLDSFFFFFFHGACIIFPLHFLTDFIHGGHFFWLLCSPLTHKRKLTEQETH